MKKKMIFLLIIGVVVVAIAIAIKKQKPATEPATEPTSTNTATNTENPAVSNTQPTAPTPIAPTATETTVKQPVKEFTMTSFVDFVDGKPKPQFSLKEMTVNKGDLVRIKITVTKGMHDFKIDEYNIYADTQLDKEAVIEFTADKTGEFIYYCTKPGHRQNGQWGTLKVVE